MKKILFTLVAAIMLVGCTKVVDDGKVNVVTTVGMLADAVENVGGDLVNVDSLMGPGVDPHLYNASAGDVKRMVGSDVVFYVGLHLEGKMIDAFEALGDKAVAVSDGLDKKKLINADPEVFGGAYDPHVWFDVDLWSEILPVIVDKLSELDPENREVYELNAKSYLSDLDSLNNWVLSRVSELSPEQRILVTAHDAFGYFGKAYGFEVRGLQGISTASDFGVKDLEVLIDFIVERGVKAVFVESSVSPKAIEALRQGVESKKWNVEIGGELFSDAMGDANTDEGTYVGMVRHNVNTIVNSLK
ncbi:manganese transporter [Candidatus Peregrinibacteria bacterium CG10_big_fil_rev_8_21_14_0_10_36_19]|nr:MAG: manganese transporter [Candidatus Peregrinibacteria bacterium CG10_big_fil_rev_8_21_14_0_10_36_19]